MCNTKLERDGRFLSGSKTLCCRILLATKQTRRTATNLTQQTRWFSIHQTIVLFSNKKTGKRAVKHVMLYQQRPTALLAYSHATQLNLE